MNRYLWSSLIALLIHLSLTMGVDGASEKSPASEQRKARQAAYRGNYKFQMPSYLTGYSPDAYARTIYSNDRRDSDGSFNYEYQTDNGISVKQESTGYGANKVVRGYYSYFGADGKQYTVNYIADRFGYRASGDHLPTQPDIPYNPSPPSQVYQTPSQIYQQSAALPTQIISSTPRPAPTNLYANRYHQHHTQTSFVPADTLQSQNIYVTERAPSNFINITPKPFISSTPLSVRILPPVYNNYNPYQPIAWTTPRPLVSF